MFAPSSRFKRLLRSLLWYAAFLVMLPLWAYGVWIETNLWLALLGLPVATLMIYFSIDKRVCPSCGKVVRMVSSGAPHCMYCGAAYQQKPNESPTQPAD